MNIQQHAALFGMAVGFALSGGVIGLNGPEGRWWWVGLSLTVVALVAAVVHWRVKPSTAEGGAP